MAQANWVEEIKTAVTEQGDAFEKWKSSFEAKWHDRISDIDNALVKMGRPGARSGGDPSDGMSAGERKSLESAYRAWVKGDVSGLQTAMEEIKSMGTGSDPDGGYLVRPTIDMQFVRLETEVSPFLGMVRSIPLTSGDALEGLLDLQPTVATWVGEEESRPDTYAPQLGNARIELKEIYAQPSMTQKLLDVASIDVIAWVNGKIAEAFASKKTIAVISGDGMLQPRGLTTYTTSATGDSTRSWGEIEHVVTGANGAFAASNPADVLFDIEAALKPRYRTRASWILPRSVAKLVRKFKDSTGQYLWQPSLQAGQPAMLIGYPVVIVEEMPALATGSLSMGLGDWREAYCSIMRPGVKLLTDPYTDKPKVKQYAYTRFGGGVANFEALKLLRFST